MRKILIKIKMIFLTLLQSFLVIIPFTAVAHSSETRYGLNNEFCKQFARFY